MDDEKLSGGFYGVVKVIKKYQKMELFPPSLEGTAHTRSYFWWGHLRRAWPMYLLGFLAVLGTNLAQVMEPKIIQWSLESFEQGQPKILYYTVMIGVLYLGQAFVRYLWRVTLAQQSHVVSAAMKSRVWEHARFFPLNRIQRDLNVGELMNLATGDVNTAKFIFGFTLVGTIDFVFLLLITIGAMLFIDVKLTLVSLSVLLLIPFLVDRIAKKERLLHDQAQNELSFLSEEVAQAISTVRLQKLTLSQKFWLQRLKNASQKYRDKRWELLRTELKFIPTTGFAPIISSLVLIVLSLPKLIDGSMTIGAFVALSSLLYVITDPLMELGWLVSEWQVSLTSLKRYTNLLNQEREELLVKTPESVQPVDYSIEVKNLSFSYTQSAQKVFQNLNRTINSGERLGIKGEVGTGKSTFLEVLARFHPYYEGEIFIGGVNLKNFSQEQLRDLVSIVPQKPFLFADSIWNNVQMNQELSEEEVWKYLDLAGLKKDVEGFPQKLQTHLGEWGVNLSGGQKQRLTLARALAKSPKILFLDDCLSAVDTVTEDQILRNLNEFFKETTVIWAAHRDSTLKYCHQVWELSHER